jgi:tol-pal system protein YbgF
MRFITLATCILLAPLATGCFWVTTKSEGKKLRTQIDDVDSRLEKREVQYAGKIKKLQEVLDEATGLLKRNSADLGADVQGLSDDIRTMQGLITAAKSYTDEVKKEHDALVAQIDNERAVAQKRIVSLEERVAALEEKVSKPVAQSAAELWVQGKALYDGGDYAEAHKAFKRLVIQFPGHDRADDAQYYRGEAYFKTRDYDDAIREYQKVFDKYATSSLADDALYRAGEAALALKRCAEARAYFGVIRQKYPRSSLVNKSKSQDREIKKNLRNKKKCIG